MDLNSADGNESFCLCLFQNATVMDPFDTWHTIVAPIEGKRLYLVGTVVHF